MSKIDRRWVLGRAGVGLRSDRYAEGRGGAKEGGRGEMGKRKKEKKEPVGAEGVL